MGKKSISKWFLGTILVFLYLAFFVYQVSVNMGVTPLVLITLAWCWVFYKATGIDIGFLADKDKK